MLLFGVMTPVRSMPEWLQIFTYLNPLRYSVEILRTNLLTGAGFELLWPKLVTLAVFSVSPLTVAALRFQKRAA